MLFPIGDENKRATRPAYITYSLIAANLVVFFLLQGAGGNEAFTYGWSVVPQEIVSGEDLTQTQTVRVGNQSVDIPQHPGPTPIYLTILSAMFMHGGLMHLFGNMLYLWIFGDNIEDRMGRARFLAFYLVCGVAAVFAQALPAPEARVPMVGASGAISGVLGAYLLFFPNARVLVLVPIGFILKVIRLPAIWVLGLWFGIQLISSLLAPAGEGGVAFRAHLGGFIAGLVLARVFLPRRRLR